MDFRKIFAAALSAAAGFAALADTHATATVAQDCEGMGSVAALDKTVAEGASVSLKATAAKGYVFSGWYLDGAPAETKQDFRIAANTCVAAGETMAFEARFTPIPEDSIEFDFENDLSDFWAGDALDEGYVLDVVSSSFPTVTLSGLPSGLKFDAKTLTLSGTPSREGIYYITATGKNASGYQYSQIIRCTVGSPDEPEETVFDAYPDFTGLEGLLIGEPVGDPASIEDAPCVGVYSIDDKEGVTAVSGLPAGLKVVSYTEDGFTYHYVTGTPTKAGLFTVTAKVTCENEDGRKVTGSSTAKIIVGTFPSVYFDVTAGEGGTASGSGVYAAGATVALKATPAKGYVFTGWAENEETAAETPGEDWRNPAQKIYVDSTASTTWLAMFAPAEDDASIEIESDDFADGETVEYDPLTEDAEALELVYAVDSISLPTVKVSGLPAGFAYSTKPDGADFIITFDPATAKKTPAPGIYPVTITARNVSKAETALAFNIRIANITDPLLPAVPDDLGAFDPDVEIEPIVLSGIVDFDSGATLSVAGLPKGLVFNAKENARTGAAANTITGTPTAPGTYTVTFNAKIPASAVTNSAGKVTYTYATASATSTLIVNPFPETAVEIDEDAAAAGCKATGAGNYPAGKKVTLKATPAKDWVFAGWEGLPDDAAWNEILNPSYTFTTGSDDFSVYATFVHVSEDSLWINEPEGDEFLFRAGESVTNTTAILDLIESVSLPTVKVSGLPAGLKFDAKTALLSGTPSKVGIYYTTVSAKNAGGYEHSRILEIIVADAEGNEPEKPEETDDAGINLSDLDSLEITTGDWFTPDYEESLLYFDVFTHPETDSEVAKIAVSGLPQGLSYTTVVEDGTGAFMLYGTPVKPGRFTLTVTVTYADRKTAKTVKTFTVLDGGSYYVGAGSMDESLGTVSGAGVYAAGATVKLTAKAANNAVFAGWYNEISDSETGAAIDPFYAISAYDGIDYRTAAISFPLRPREVDLESGFWGDFVPKTNDTSIAIELAYPEEDDIYALDGLDYDQVLQFAILSSSLPKATVTGLPKGMTFDAARGEIAYESAKKSVIVPGVYSVVIKATNQSKAAAEKTITITVPNKESEIISADPAMDAYVLTIGTDIGEAFADIATTDDDYTLSVSGLPSGVTFKNGVFSGTPSKTGSFTVTLTAKKSGAATETATITVTVEALPVWAVGTFDGICSVSGLEEQGVNPQEGAITATITANGALSGKATYLSGSSVKTVSFKAKNADGIVELNAAEIEAMGVKDKPAKGAPALVYRGVYKMTGSDKTTYAADIYVWSEIYGQDGTVCGRMAFVPATPETPGEWSAFAAQSPWTSSAMAEPEFAGKPVFAIEEPDFGDAAKIELTFGAKGSVTVKAFKAGARSAYETVSAKLAVLSQTEEGSFVASITAPMPKSGGVLELAVELVPGEDGKIAADGITATVAGKTP